MEANVSPSNATMNIEAIKLLRVDLEETSLLWVLLDAWVELARDSKLSMDKPRWKKPGGWKRYAHLTCDSIWTLEIFELGIFGGEPGKQHRVTDRTTRPHIDLPEDKVRAATLLGARLLPSPAIAKIARAAGEAEMRATRRQPQ